MADPVETAKDVSIAFLSASALLLTLILGFISPTLTRNWALTLALQSASLLLLMTTLFSAYSLWKLVEFPADTLHLPKEFISYYKTMFVFFFPALVLIIAAIYLKLG